MPEMNDPNSMRFGYGFRRRFQDLESRREATPEEKELAAEKEKLAQQIEQLERQMQQQAQGIAGGQPDASSKMRKALSAAEEKELALRMQKDAEWMRQGYGNRNLGMQDSVTAGLDQLSRELREVQQSLKSGNQRGQNGQNGQDDKDAQALNEIRSLRDQLELMSQGRQPGREGELSRDGQPGQQNGSNPQSANGQQNGQQGGQQSGQQSGQQGGQQGQAGQRGGPTGLGSPYSPYGGGGLDRRGVEGAIGYLNGLRSQVDPRDREFYGYLNGAIWNLRHLTGAQDGLLDERISRDAAVSLQRLELELSKRLAEQQAEGARTGKPEASPEKYRDAVAEYFKKLSQSK
jgi:hypothetical protein